MAGVRARGARGAILTCRALTGLADHACAARGSVRLIVRFGAHGDTRCAGDRSDSARIRRHGTSGPGRAGGARTVVADHVRAAIRAVALRLAGVGARSSSAGRTYSPADVAKVGRITRRTGCALRRLRPRVRQCPTASAGCTAAYARAAYARAPTAGTCSADPAGSTAEAGATVGRARLHPQAAADQAASEEHRHQKMAF